MTAKEARRIYAAAYMRQYRANNKEKVAEINRKYWIRRAAQLTQEQEKQENGGGVGNEEDFNADKVG